MRDVAGGVREHDSVRGELTVNAESVIIESTIQGGRTHPPELVGHALARGWSRALAVVFPDERTVLATVLEDLAGAFLVSGYAPLRGGVLAMTLDDAIRAAERQQDVCIGWARGGPLVELLARTAQNAVPMGPQTAPGAVKSPEWHTMEPLPKHGVRRIRRLDVTRDGPDLIGAAHFRDSYGSTDSEMVMHEYLVDSRVGNDGCVSAIAVDPRVLPWETCPGAVHSAQRVVGASVTELVELARQQLRGPTTCTHLTSTVRSLADVAYLASLLLDRGEA